MNVTEAFGLSFLMATGAVLILGVERAAAVGRAVVGPAAPLMEHLSDVDVSAGWGLAAGVWLLAVAVAVAVLTRP